MSVKITVRVRTLRRARRLVALGAVLALFVLVVGLGIYLAMQFHSVQRGLVYPYPYQDIVRKYAEKYKIDSSLAAAVIKAESKFEHTAVSHRGAVGLMQIMPDTGDWISEQLEDREYAPHRLSEPEINIRYGLWYLSALRKEFRNNDILALAAYNAGRGNVTAWMEEYGWDYDFDDIEAIPFGETREYVRKVLENKAKYKELYH